jgi:HSP20 family molecular chaperone IbpA
MTPQLQQFDDRDGDALRRYEYDDSVVYAADIGSDAGEAAVDVVDGTVMVVSGDEQADFEIPESGTAEATIKNGVLTVEVER